MAQLTASCCVMPKRVQYLFRGSTMQQRKCTGDVTVTSARLAGLLASHLATRCSDDAPPREAAGAGAAGAGNSTRAFGPCQSGSAHGESDFPGGPWKRQAVDGESGLSTLLSEAIFLKLSKFLKKILVEVHGQPSAERMGSLMSARGYLL